MKITVRTPATSANLGPGFDCAAVALDLWNELEVTDGEGVVVEGEGADELPADETNLAIRAYELVAPTRGKRFVFLNRALGPLAWGYWIMVACNVCLPQLFWFKKVRITPAAVLGIAVLINLGMWFERFVIIVTSLERDFLPSSWAHYAPTLIH